MDIIFIIIQYFMGWLLGNYIYVKIIHYSLFGVLLRYIWLLGTFVNSLCDIKISIKIINLLYKLGGERVNSLLLLDVQLLTPCLLNKNKNKNPLPLLTVKMI